MPFTLHATAEFAVPVTEAENVCDAPTRKFAVGGATVTVTGEFCGGAGGFADAGLLPDAQPPNRKGSSSTASARAPRRSSLCAWYSRCLDRGRHILGSLLQPPGLANCTEGQKKSDA